MREDERPIKEALAPGFIVAMPQLDDPNFHRSVVLLLRHGDDGAFGLIVNRPGAVPVMDLLESQDITYGGPPDQRLMTGGPVEADRNVLVLHGESPRGGDDELEIAEGIYLVTAREGLLRLASRPNGRFRCYLGYSGWGPGQLESELAEGAWLALPAAAPLVFHDDPGVVWQAALRAAGIDPAALVPGLDTN